MLTEQAPGFKEISDLYHLREDGHVWPSSALSVEQESEKMPIYCPSCNSEHIRTRNFARKVGGAAGALGGAATGAASAVTGAQSGAALGAVAGPIGAVLGGVAGAILGGLAGGAVGSLAGARMGEEIDARVLDNFECQACGHVFSVSEN